jgi:hypothetical protein
MLNLNLAPLIAAIPCDAEDVVLPYVLLKDLPENWRDSQLLLALFQAEGLLALVPRTAHDGGQEAIDCSTEQKGARAALLLDLADQLERGRTSSERGSALVKGGNAKYIERVMRKRTDATPAPSGPAPRSRRQGRSDL